MTIQEFVAENNITATSARTDSNPTMDAGMDHWKVTLKGNGRHMTLTFSKGYGHNGAPPTVEEVLDCLRSDAWYTENGNTFEDFCNELGYDTDSRKAEKIYKACVRQTEKLKSFLGDTFDEFLNCEED